MEAQKDLIKKIILWCIGGTQKCTYLVQYLPTIVVKYSKYFSYYMECLISIDIYKLNL